MLAVLLDYVITENTVLVNLAFRCSYEGFHRYKSSFAQQKLLGKTRIDKVEALGKLCRSLRQPRASTQFVEDHDRQL